jgi:hypothetical protein
MHGRGAFDLPSERFGSFELTDEKGGERLDRIPIVRGEIRIGDRAYLQPIASVRLSVLAPILWCGQVGGMPVGSAPRANRSICSLCCAKERSVD